MKEHKIKLPYSLDAYMGTSEEVGMFDIDHFVPWSFVANDELWILAPMEKRLNCSKSNKLPVWDKYFRGFADNQFMMFECVQEKEKIKEIFGK